MIASSIVKSYFCLTCMLISTTDKSFSSSLFRDLACSKNGSLILLDFNYSWAKFVSAAVLLEAIRCASFFATFVRSFIIYLIKFSPKTCMNCIGSSNCYFLVIDMFCNFLLITSSDNRFCSLIRNGDWPRISSYSSD